MAAAPSEAEILVNELESRVDRLRSLYDQYFCGLEKIEPMVPRKDVDRRIAHLRKANLRNTALRFRFSTTIQRYNTYQAYWQRICRQIEEGTYKRDVRRAEARFGKTETKGLRRGEPSALELNEVDFEDFEEDLDVESLRGTAAAISDGLDTLRPQVVEAAAAVVPPHARSPHFPPPEHAPASAAAAAAASRAGATVAPRTGSGTRPRSTPPALPARPRTESPAMPPPQLQSRAANGFDADFDDPFAAATVRPRRGAGESPPLSEASTGTVPVPLPFAPLTQAQVARPGMLATGASPRARVPAAPSAPLGTRAPPPIRPVASPGVPGAPGLAAVRAPTNVPPAAPPSPAAPPAPAPRAATQVPPPQRAPTNVPPRPQGQPRPPSQLPSPPHAQPRVAPARGDLSDERVRQLYSQYVEAKRSRQESTAAITFDGLAKSLRDSRAKLREKHGDKQVDFEVTVKDGKTILRPVVK